MGAAYLAGLATGYWKSTDEIASLWQLDTNFTPGISSESLRMMKSKWADAVERAKSWHKG